MEDRLTWLASFETAMVNLTEAVLTYLPSLFLAIGVLIVGWLFARFLRNAIRRMASGINRILDRFLRRGPLANARLSTGAAATIGELAFWTVIFITIVISLRSAGFNAVAGWLGQIVEQLPNLLVGTAIIFVGYILSGLVGEQVAESARSAKARQSALLGKLAQVAIFITALIIGLDQIGVQVTFLVALFAIAIGAVFIGFSIAFGLGAQDYVSNLIGSRVARRELIAGHRVRIGNLEGELLEITPTHIAIDTENGRTLIPAHSMSIERIIDITIVDSSTDGHG